METEHDIVVETGKGKTEYGPGVEITLSGDDVARSIDNYLKLHEIGVNGPRTVQVNDDLCRKGRVYVDPSGYVIHNGNIISGRGDDIDSPAIHLVTLYGMYMALCTTHARAIEIRDTLIDDEGLTGPDVLCVGIHKLKVDELL